MPDLAQQMAEPPQRSGMRIGIVVSTAPLLVSLNGGTLDSAGTLRSYTPRVGDNVAMVRQGSTWLVLGATASGDGTNSLPGIAGYNNIAGTGTTTSASFADMPGATTFAFAKRTTSSLVRVDFGTTFFVAGAQAGVEFGVRMNAIDTAISRYLDTLTINVRLSAPAGQLYLTGIPAGDQTITLRWRRVRGTGTVSQNGDDWLSFAAMEVG